MKSLKNKILGLIFLLLSAACAHARICVRVINQLENGQRMNVHCRSKDNDLGYHMLEDGGSTSWGFGANLWGTTFFYCDVQWGNSNWHHFDAYDDDRDFYRCRSVCRWMISREGLLYGYDEQTGLWEWFPLINVVT